jgi:ribonuclease R
MGKLKKAGKHRINKANMGEILESYFKENPGRTISFKEIFHELHLNTHPLKMLAIEVMEEMAWDDFITRMSNTSYMLRESDSQTQEGTFIRKPNGRNSFQPDGAEKSVLVTERNSLYAMNGDRVRVTFMARRRKHTKEAKVVEIVKRAKDTFVGRLRVDEDVAFLVVQDGLIPNDIIIPKKKLKGGRTDDKAVVKVTRWPDEENQVMVGEVIDVLGKSGDNDVEMNTILVQYGLPYKYPQNVEDEANKITGEITEKDYAEREDFRDVFTCTIDPADAKDFDDALSIRKLESGLWEVGVHIADVSHYVTENSVIDKEARKRATSIYLVDRTIPMLPERLCNFVCSLRPDEEKLAYSVIFNMDDHANVQKFRIVHTVVKSNRRFTYEEVQKILTDSNALDGSQFNPKGEYAAELCQLWAIAKQLRDRRFANGAVQFEGEEMKFELDEKGKPIRCYFKKTVEANNLIEEFMLLANRTVAESVGKVKKGQKAKTLPYRVHDNPDPLKLENLKEFVVKFGYRMKSTSTKGEISRSLNHLMDDCKGKKEQKLIQMVALRSMMKAKYTIHNIGHFGLAFDYYTHFTSPIRRYPDTMVHRLLTRYAKGAPSANKVYYEELCEHSSDMEQIAANAERDSVKYKAVEFMSERIGKVFDAHISGITSYGIYCEVDENHCEGMVPMRDLRGDYYEFDEKNYCLRGRRHGNVYRLGDPVTIKVMKANLEKKQLDYILADK